MNTLIKVNLLCSVFVVLNIVLSVIFGTVVLSTTPKKIGTIQLEKDYREYTTNELDSIIRNKFDTSAHRKIQDNDLFNNITLIGPMLLWILGVVLFRKYLKIYMVYAFFSLFIAYLMGVFSFIQVSIMYLSVLIVIFFLNNFRGRGFGDRR